MTDFDQGASTHVASKRAPRAVCAISGKERLRRDLIPLEAIRPSLAERMRADHPELAPDALVSLSELSRYRTLYVEELLKAEHGELTELDRQVAESMATHETLAENIEEEFEDRRTLGERLSDRLASFGGSWIFIVIVRRLPARLDGVQSLGAARRSGSIPIRTFCSTCSCPCSPPSRRRSS